MSILLFLQITFLVFLECFGHYLSIKLNKNNAAANLQNETAKLMKLQLDQQKQYQEQWKKMQENPCPMCKTEGQVDPDCEICKGKGWLESE